MVHKNAWLALGLALILGGVLRFYQLVNFPPSLNWDEASHAYNAWSLLTTGKDQWNQTLPVFNFRAYGDYPTTLNLYGTVPAIALFGPSDFTARFPQALLGVLSIVLAFGIGYHWKKNWQQGVLMAFLTAVEPWTVFTSRQVLQSNWTVFLAFAFLLFFLRRNKLKGLLILLVSLFSYHNARIFVPMACVLFLLVWKNKLIRIVTVVVLLFSLFILLSPSSRARSNVVGILDSGAVASIEDQRNSSNMPELLKRLMYNRPVYLSEKVLTNYLDYFLPPFLFIHGGTQYQFSLPKFGLLTYLDLPFFYLGLGLLVIEYPVLAIVFLLSPLPAAITQDRFAVVRSTIMIPFVLLAVSMGFARLKKPKLTWVYIIVILGLLIGYYHNYFTDYVKNYSQSWQYGYKQAIEYTWENQNKFDQIIFTKRYGEPHEYLLWYEKIKPSVYLQDLAAGKVDWNYHDNWYWIQRINNVVFVNDWELNDYLNKLPKTGKYLVVSSPDNVSQGQVLTTINFLDGKIAFIIKDL